MNLKKVTVATLTSGFGMWIISGLWHNLIMPNLYREVTAKHEGIGILLIAYFILAFFMAYLFGRIYKGGSYIKEGLFLGVIIGIIWVFPHELAMAAAHGEPLAYVFKNGLWHVVEQGLGGIIVGLVYSKFQKSPAKESSGDPLFTSGSG